MDFKRIEKTSCWALMLAAQIMLQNAFAEVEATSPCDGANAILTLINRPTFANSPCVVPFKKAMLEAGYQYEKLRHTGTEQNFPEAELRIGLPADNEIFTTLPNYVHQSIIPHSGYNATSVGIKHALAYEKDWIVSAESIFILPSGSADFGSDGLGATLNGIFAYSFSPQFTLSLMMGVTSQTLPSNQGGGRYNSFNPDIVLAFPVQEKLALYGEVYGQTKTAPDQGSGFNMDTGLLYMLLQNFSVDLEVGQRLYGNLNGFDHYIGTGIGLLF